MAPTYKYRSTSIKSDDSLPLTVDHFNDALRYAWNATYNGIEVTPVNPLDIYIDPLKRSNNYSPQPSCSLCGKKSCSNFI